jgi:hypothetical protein
VKTGLAFLLQTGQIGLQQVPSGGNGTAGPAAIVLTYKSNKKYYFIIDKMQKQYPFIV